jgi:hypothetical protein
VGPRAVLDVVVKRKIPSSHWESNNKILGAIAIFISVFSIVVLCFVRNSQPFGGTYCFRLPKDRIFLQTCIVI